MQLFSKILCFAIVCIVLGCSAPVSRIVQPKQVSSVYLVPDWGTKNEERLTLIHSLSQSSNSLFILLDSNTDTNSNNMSLPETSAMIHASAFSIAVIIDGQPIEAQNISNPEQPVIALIKGNTTSDVLKMVQDNYKPVWYIIAGDHYAQIEDIHNTPAVIFGCNDFANPFTGDFPHILAITKSGSALSVRPVDIDGFYLKTSQIKSDTLNRLYTLQKSIAASIRFQEWDTYPAEQEAVITLQNPFSKKLIITFGQVTASDAWKINGIPDSLEINPGSTKNIKLVFTVETSKAVADTPEWAYTILVNDIQAGQGKLAITSELIASPKRDK